MNCCSRDWRCGIASKDERLKPFGDRVVRADFDIAQHDHNYILIEKGCDTGNVPGISSALLDEFLSLKLAFAPSVGIGQCLNVE